MSTDDGTRILMVGDMHLGRRPGGLPAGLDPATLGPVRALELVVDTALERNVQAVVFAGDLVDGANDRFEAFTPLADATRRLLAAGIPVAAVAGNHDTVVLPRLADLLDEGFHFLGPGGTWSSLRIPGTGGPPVTVTGWSFPANHWEHSPLETPPPEPVPGEVTLGLIHGDLHDPGSRYAPVAREALLATGYAGWFLGHTHKPAPLGTPPFIVDLGSLCPLHANETGVHGPVLLTIDKAGALDARRLALAPLRRDYRTLDCSSLTGHEEDLGDHLLAAMVAWGSSEERPPQLQALGLRVTLTGRVENPSRLARAVSGLHSGQMATGDSGLTVFVEKLHDEVTGQHDLVALAAGSDPVGLLAGAILAVSADPADPAAAAWIALADEVLEKTSGNPGFTLLPEDRRTLDPAALRALFLRQAHHLLDVLARAGKGGRHESA